MLRSIATVTVCTLAFSLAGVAAAQAASSTLVDGAGDVWKEGFDQQGRPAPTRTPHRSQGDILRTVFDHQQQQVVIRHRFAQLNRQGRQILVSSGVRTNAGLSRAVVLDAGPGAANNRWRGETTMFGFNHRVVQCAITHDIDYAANVVVIRIPRTCLDNPQTIEASSYVRTVTNSGDRFIDNPVNHLGTLGHLVSVGPAGG